MTGLTTPARPPVEGARGARGRRRRRLDSTTVSHYVIWALAVLVIVGPIVPVAVASLWTTPLYESGGEPTLQNYRDLLTDDAWWSAVSNSVVFATIMTAGSVVLGVGAAVLFTRTNLPGRGILATIFLLPVMLPGIVLVLGWGLMWSQAGFATTWLRTNTFLGMPIDLYSIPGMALVGISVAAPVIFLFCRNTLAAIDPALEDAARMAGAGPVRVLATVSVRLLRPAILNSTLLVFAIALEVLGLPLVLGYSSDIDMISTYLYNNWTNVSPPRHGLVSAGAVLMLVTVSALLVLRNKLVGDVGRFAAVTGKPTGSRALELGPVRWLASAGMLIVLLVLVLVPLAGVVMSAFTTVFTPFVSPWESLSTINFENVFANPVFTKALVNSLLIASVGGLLTTLAIAMLSVIAHRSDFRLRGSLQQAMMWPRMIPGLVTGMAFFWSLVILDPSGSIRSTLWGMGLAFAVRSLALGYSAFYPALAAVGRDLDLAARTSGATWWTAMRTIVLRLVMPAMAASFILLFVAMLNDAEPAVFLVTDGTPVLGLTMLQLAATNIGGSVAALGVIQMVITLAVLGIGRGLFGVRPRA
ncbi:MULTISPECIES: ABC transporter permease [Actinomadura]|uniref:Iron(III) transport system permease protein n=1 Tax=Actinomadura madurae TaxID=1993 RepID=A0A1I5J2R6_9ACTN|nr:iron ABC transporter permease [Actinomadura madurae]SFO67154.1 iron(III) transport system permease protein [Actinomadura madurae]SPT58620.1 Inner membrane ABC transporter permease protein ycjO [Actinomadura madurae]